MSLAKLSNRTHATARLEEEMARAKRDTRGECSIVLVQFDGLSDVADRLGYAFGDDMWRHVLGVLVQDVRPQDMCCRLGGDEFLLILPGRGLAECRAVADRLCRRWNPGPGTRESNVEVNVGVAAFPSQGTTMGALLASADEDMQANRFQHEMLRGSAPAESRAA
ncbi:MAG: GGDEF domain-containing protein [Verrucomicrobiota bacterium]